MRVLWFANTSSLASKIILGSESSSTGNWIISLEKEIRNFQSVNLGVAVYGFCNKDLEKLQNGNTLYYILPRKHRTKARKLLSNWYGLIEGQKDQINYLEIIKDFNPDIIHFWGLEFPFVSVLPMIQNIPTIVHLQGILNPYSYKYYPTFKPTEINRSINFGDKLKGISFQSSRKKFYRRLSIESKYAAWVKNYFGRTDWDRRCAKILSPYAKYYHCDEIMREEFYTPIWDKKRDNKITLFTTISESPFKGLDTIFDVEKILHKSYPELNYTWEIAGIHQCSLSVEVMKRKGFDVNSRFKYLGPLNAKQLVDQLLKADLFVYLSRIENGCNAVQESMLLGLPIISTFAGGLSTTINDKVTGILVQEGEPFSIAGAILELIENPTIVYDLGKNARNVALKRHDPTNIVNTVINTYSEIINNHVYGVY